MSAAREPRWVVLKFGGTSVSSLGRWQTIETAARERLGEGLRPLIVCSALSGVTDRLEALLEAAGRGQLGDGLDALRKRHVDFAAALGADFEREAGEEFEALSRVLTGADLLGEVSTRARARVLARGELLSSRLGAAYLHSRGLAVRWLDARDCLTARDEPGASEKRRILSASCTGERDEALGERLAADRADVFVTQGFIARDAEGGTVVLGRGGSDTSAAYLAAALGAVRCEIWTDVPGLFTANPRIIPAARLLRALDYDEAQEIASTGAKVLHPRCLSPLRHAGIPIHVLSTDHPQLQGTVISRRRADQGARVKALSWRKGITLISMDSVGMWQQVGFLADVFACFKRRGLSVDAVSTSETNVTASLDPTANALDPQTIDGLLEDLRPYCRPTAIGPCAAVSLVGRRIRAIMHQLGPALEVFEEQRIHLVSQAASDLNLTFVVDEDQAERLVRQLHSMLFRHAELDPVFGPTSEHVFGGPPAPAAGAGAWWRRRRHDLLKLAAEGSPAYVYDRESLERAAASLAALSNVDRTFYSMKANPHADVLRIVEGAGLGIECVSVGELERVLELFPGLDPGRRILFTPNFAPRSEYERGFAAGAIVTLDNLHPLAEWPELFAGREVFVRLDPGSGRGHHAHVRTAGTASKFGIAEADLDELARLAAGASCSITGLHAHRGSGILDSRPWAETALFLAGVAERHFPDAKVLDLGGGLGVPERPDQAPLALSELDDSLAPVKRAHPRFELWLEPGRYVVAAAGVLLARVTQTKRKGPVSYVGIDAGMNSLIRPALYGAFHEIVNLTRLDEERSITASIVGPICETGDTLGHSRRLPASREGDVILIANAGAYGSAMASRYNLREPAREVLLGDPAPWERPPPGAARGAP
jgi:diaminopimelate decarboxylase/aspartate kinase